MKGIRWIIFGFSVAVILGALLICAAFGFFDREKDPHPNTTGSVTADSTASNGDTSQSSYVTEDIDTVQTSMETFLSTEETTWNDLSTGVEVETTDIKETEATIETEETKEATVETEETKEATAETEETTETITETEATETEAAETEVTNNGDFSFDFSDLLGG